MNRLGEAAIPFDRTTDAQAPAQRARGVGWLQVRRRGATSVIGDLHQSGSAKLLFPRANGPAMQAVWLNTAGGITGGDRFALRAEALEGAALSMTTQAAERVYRASPGAPGHVVNKVSAGPDARIDWLPQETILFDHAALDRQLRFDLDGTARLLACETLIFGRAAMGEDVRALDLRDRIDVYSDGRLRFADRLRLQGDAHAQLQLRGVTAGARAVASVIFVAPEAETWLPRLRDMLPDTAGASAPDKGLVFLRLVASDSFEMRRHLIPVLRLLSGADLPRPWTI